MSGWELFMEAVPVAIPMAVALGFISRSPRRWHRFSEIRAAQEYLAAQLGREPVRAVARPKPSRFEVLTRLADPVQVAWLKVLGGMAFGGLLYVFVTQWPKGVWPR